MEDEVSKCLHRIYQIVGAPDETSFPGISRFHLFRMFKPVKPWPRDVEKKYGK
jgi:hypothetical protein